MPAQESLSRREREIVNVLYALGGPAAVEDIRARLQDPPSYSAVRAMLAKLEAKGSVRHQADGPRYLYTPTTPMTAARRRAVRQLVNVFFGGSPRQTVTALLRQESWTDEELDAMRAEIDAARPTRNRS